MRRWGSVVGLGAEAGEKDRPTVDAEGAPIAGGIAGVYLRPLVLQADERGEPIELLSQSWPEAAGGRPAHIYMSTVEPGVVKGWVMHLKQSDRIAVLNGRLRWVLYDGRSHSPTAERLQVLTLTERNWSLLVIPSGVWHAAQNVGAATAGFLNMPTRPYNHGDPDKYRLPLDTAEIPFSFARPAF